MPGPDPTVPVKTGRTLGGRYRLVEPLARGGMAEVWEGHDEVLSRPVAVKILQAHLASDGVFLERFRREAVTAARLAHPCVVSTYDTGIDDGTAFIVMELVRGDTLRQLLSEHGALEPWLAVTIARQIADALADAHQAGLVHRDIKPANILLVDDGWGGVRVKVTDFGIAKASQGLGADLTRTGTVLGTPKYLSPEQIRGHEPDARADLYSLGVVLFEMLAGTPPYSGSTDMATALSHLNDRIPKLSDRVRGVPAPLERLVRDLLSKDAADRVPSALVLRERLDSLGLVPSGARQGAGSPRKGAVLPAIPARQRIQSASAKLSGRASTTGVGRTDATAVGPAAGAGHASEGNGATTLIGSQGGDREIGTIPLRVGPNTDAFEQVPRPQRRGHRRSGRWVGWVVLALVVAGAVTAAVLVGTSGGGHRSAPPAPAQSGAAPGIASVNVFMVNHRPPDNPQDVHLAYDGNPTTFWPTDQYPNPTFGNLYPGIGLAIHLDAAEQGRELAVTALMAGWSAQVYVSSGPVASGQPVSAWGSPTDAKTSIPEGTTVFKLGNRTAQWVLLWITNLGHSDEGRIAELSLR